ncbi:unnamed protein product [Prorocentrum cordatum]|uniref:Uncharacterized protein n=1 Tax=Prorocentrum cordatum TaxID=2364126 RepID=A0ABN9U2P8_9DINO|nr:unnamed protein product [Polarella glacialis]
MLQLPQGRPHARELKIGNGTGFWTLSLSVGIHWHGMHRAPGVPLHGQEDAQAERLTTGAVLLPSWHDDEQMEPRVLTSVGACCLGDDAGDAGLSQRSLRRAMGRVQKLTQALLRGESLAAPCPPARPG